jgi:hypothetical protein
MWVRLLFLLAVLPLLSGWGNREPSWPYAGPMPDEPIAVPAARYVPLGAGTKSYRPVEPMPWGDVNQRVAPRQGKSPTNMPEKHEEH